MKPLTYMSVAFALGVLLMLCLCLFDFRDLRRRLEQQNKDLAVSEALVKALTDELKVVRQQADERAATLRALVHGELQIKGDEPEEKK